MYERLTKRFLGSNAPYTEFTDNEILNRLCELEDKICEGRMVELPCAVGQTVYEIDLFDFEPCKHCGENGDVCPHLYAEVGFGYECEKTRYGEKLWGCSEISPVVMEDITDIFHRWHKFGEIVFLTPEEANNKLKESE